MEANTLAKLPVGKILPSIVAIACGRFEDGSMNVIGTGFGVGTSTKDENIMLIATCEHVASGVFQISDLEQAEGRREGLIDNCLRIAMFEDGNYSWKEIKEEFGFCDAQDKGASFAEKHDACILRVPGIKIPSRQCPESAVIS